MATVGYGFGKNLAARLKQFLRLQPYCHSAAVYIGGEAAHDLLDEISQRNLTSLNAVLSAHLRKKDPDATWNLFSQMHRVRSDLDAYTYTPVIGACSALSDKLRGQQVHTLLTKTCSEFETIAKTALVDMYFKCNCLSDSVKVFEEMKDKDVVTWNAMITGLLHNDKPRYALRVFEEMSEVGVEFSSFTLCNVIKACSKLKAIRQGMQVHGLVIVMGCDLLVLGTALIDLYSHCALIEEALKVFNTLNCRKDTAIYNALVSGCVLNSKYKESIKVLSSMKPNEIALTSGLGICARYTDLSLGKQVHCVAIRFGFDSDTQLSNALLDMYAKCGKIQTARLLFDRISRRTVFSWTSIIDAYGSQGCGIEAYELLKTMEKSGVSPNSVTFLAVLSACAHSGLVEEGRECFVSMRKEHGIDPGSEHYACFIDLLGRASLIEEVWELFSVMDKKGITANGAVLAALLNACKLNLDIERGEFAAKLLIALEPHKPGNLVSISNFFAAIGRWDRVEEVRNSMIEKGLGKETGSSWING